MLQWEVKKRKSNTPKLSTINHVQDPVQMFFLIYWMFISNIAQFQNLKTSLFLRNL